MVCVWGGGGGGCQYVHTKPLLLCNENDAVATKDDINSEQHTLVTAGRW